MSDNTARLAQWSRLLKAAGAVPAETMSGGTHRKWRFPDGHFIQMPGHLHGGFKPSRLRNVEALMRRAIREHGSAVTPVPAKATGMKPSEVDTWTPHPHPEAPPTGAATIVAECTAVQPEKGDPMPDPLRCNVCEKPFKSKTALVAHHRTHDAPKPCPDCGELFQNVGRHRAYRHVAAAKKPAVLMTAPEPADAIKTLIAAAEGLRGYLIRLEEENKMLRRDLDKATANLERARNFLGSR